MDRRCILSVRDTSGKTWITMKYCSRLQRMYPESSSGTRSWRVLILGFDGNVQKIEHNTGQIIEVNSPKRPNSSPRSASHVTQKILWRIRTFAFCLAIRELSKQGYLHVVFLFAASVP